MFVSSVTMNVTLISDDIKRLWTSTPWW